MAGESSAPGSRNHSEESSQTRGRRRRRSPLGRGDRTADSSPARRPSDKVAAAALSPDGTRLAASRRDHTILLWDLATGGLVTLEGPADRVAYGVRFSPDGKRLVSLHRAGGSHTHAPIPMMVWDASSRKPIMTINVGPHSEASFSPDGRRLVVCPSGPGCSLCTTRRRVRRSSRFENTTVWSCRRGLQPGRHAPGRVWVRRNPHLGRDQARAGGLLAVGLHVRQPPGLQPGRQALGESRLRGDCGGLGHGDRSKGPDLQGTLRRHPRDRIQPGRHAPGDRRCRRHGQVVGHRQSGDGAAISLPDSEMRWRITDLSPDGRSLLAFAHEERRVVGHRDTPDARQPDRASRGVQQPPKLERRRRTYVPGGPWQGRGA